jgi:hypothetical protein
MSLVLTEFAEKGMLAQLLAAGPGAAGVFHGCKIAPFISNMQFTPNIKLSDLVLSPDLNLAPLAVVWGLPYRRGVGGIAADGSSSEFQLADEVNSCLCYGYYIVDSTGADLLGGENFASPVELQDILSGLVVVPQLAIGGPDFGNATVLS